MNVFPNRTFNQIIEKFSNTVFQELSSHINKTKHNERNKLKFKEIEKGLDRLLQKIQKQRYLNVESVENIISDINIIIGDNDLPIDYEKNFVEKFKTIRETLTRKLDNLKKTQANLKQQKIIDEKIDEKINNYLNDKIVYELNSETDLPKEEVYYELPGNIALILRKNIDNIENINIDEYIIPLGKFQEKTEDDKRDLDHSYYSKAIFTYFKFDNKQLMKHLNKIIVFSEKQVQGGKRRQRKTFKKRKSTKLSRKSKRKTKQNRSKK